MKLIAHRGGAGLRIENSLAAFEKALDLGAEGAELDVHLSHDGQVVVHHDDTLNSAYCRHAGGDWISEAQRRPLAEMTYAQMQSFDIGTPRPGTAYANEFNRIEPVPEQRIPRLQDVVSLVKARSDRFFLLVEIKAPLLNADTQYLRTLFDATLAVIDAQDFAARTIFCSFDWGVMRHVKQVRADLATWLISAPLSWFASGQPPATDIPPAADKLAAIRELEASGEAPWYAGFDPRRFDGSYPRAVAAAGANAWYPYHRDCTKQTCDQSRALGLDTAAWTVNLQDEQALHRVAKTGVDYLAVDYPDIKP